MATERAKLSVPGKLQTSIEQRHQGLRSLGRENLTAIETRIARGDTLAEVAKFIQKELGFYPDVKETTLIKQVQRYKLDIMEPKLLKQVLDGKDVRSTLDKLKQNMNVLQEFQELALTQKERITRALQREKEMPLLFSWLHREILTMDKLLNSVASVQMDLGILNRVPKKHIVADITELQKKAAEAHERSVVDLDEYKLAIAEFQSLVNALEGDFTVESEEGFLEEEEEEDAIVLDDEDR